MERKYKLFLSFFNSDSIVITKINIDLSTNEKRNQLISMLNKVLLEDNRNLTKMTLTYVTKHIDKTDEITETATLFTFFFRNSRLENKSIYLQCEEPNVLYSNVDYYFSHLYERLKDIINISIDEHWFLLDFVRQIYDDANNTDLLDAINFSSEYIMMFIFLTNRVKITASYFNPYLVDENNKKMDTKELQYVLEFGTCGKEENNIKISQFYLSKRLTDSDYYHSEIKRIFKLLRSFDEIVYISIYSIDCSTLTKKLIYKVIFNEVFNRITDEQVGATLCELPKLGEYKNFFISQIDDVAYDVVYAILSSFCLLDDRELSIEWTKEFLDILSDSRLLTMPLTNLIFLGYYKAALFFYGVIDFIKGEY